jgi:DNA mismatch endonuclease (patch repair protein)
MDTMTPAERSVRMGLIRSRDTKPELAVRSLVRSLGFRYRLHVKDLPGCPDLVFKRFSKVIFVNGCFWHLHNCPDCRIPKSGFDYWKPKLRSNAARDKQSLRRLKQLGWQSLVIWECELKQPDQVLRTVTDFLRDE